MGLLFLSAGGEEITATPDVSGEAETLLITLAETCNAKLRKKHALPRGATLAQALAVSGGLDRRALDPLTRTSTGILTKEDYEAQFSEDWEIAEYGRFADEVIARNRAALQDIGVYEAALRQASGVLEQAKDAVIPEPAIAREVLARLLVRVEAGRMAGATQVCVTIDDLD